MENNNGETLPQGWTICTIDQLIPFDGVFTDGDWVESKDQDPKGDVRLIQLADIGDSFFVDKSSRFLRKSKAYELNCTFLKRGDLLVARMPDPLGRACIFPFEGNEKFITVVDVCAIRLGNLSADTKYLMYLINSPSIREQIEEYKTGSTRKRISRKNLAKVQLPLAPSNEQKRIVTKIEELFSELDKGIESLKTAQEQLKIYRQAVLKHAFEGKLTAQWREENKDKLETAEEVLAHIQQKRLSYLTQKIEKGDQEAKRYLSKTKKSNSDHPDIELPSEARWVNLLDVCNFIVDCHNKTAPYESEGIYLVRTPCIKNGRIHLNDEARFISEKTYAYWARRCPPEPGDVIFTREAPVGEVGIVPDGVRLCMGQRMMLLRPPKEISSKYLLYCLMEPMLQARLGFGAVGSGVKHLRVGDVEQISIPLFPLSEQQLIVEKLDSLFSVLFQNELDIEENLQIAEVLRQSILKKAFSGQLVEQDPNDEPASVLLERIKAEKADQKGVPKKLKNNRKNAA